MTRIAVVHRFMTKDTRGRKLHFACGESSHWPDLDACRRWKSDVGPLQELAPRTAVTAVCCRTVAMFRQVAEMDNHTP